MESTIKLDCTDGIEIGDTISFSGLTHKRTFWQWVTRKQKVSLRFIVTEKGKISDSASIVEFIDDNGATIHGVNHASTHS